MGEPQVGAPQTGLRALPPGTGPLRGRIQTPSGQVFAVREATLSERIAPETWVARGTLGTDTGDVQMREGARQGEQGLLIEDRLNRYGYVYRTQQLVLLRRAARVRLDWSYTPGSIVPTALQVWRRDSGAAEATRLAEITPVAAQTQTYRYLDTDIVAGRTYEWSVVAIDAAGHSSEPSSIATLEIPHALAAATGLTALFVPEN